MNFFVPIFDQKVASECSCIEISRCGVFFEKIWCKNFGEDFEEEIQTTIMLSILVQHIILHVNTETN